MKTIRELRIDSKKLLKDDDLITFKGGTSMCFYDCSCSGSCNPPYVSPFSTACFPRSCVNEIISLLSERCLDGQGTCNQTFCI